MKRQTRLIGITIIALLSLFIIQTAHAQVAGNQGLLTGVGKECLDISGATKEQGNCSFCDIITVANNVIKLILQITGSLALIAFVLAGFWLIVSQGDATKAKKAFSIFRAATIGILLVFFSYTIVNFVLNVLISTGKGELKFTDYFKTSTWSGVCAGESKNTQNSGKAAAPTCPAGQQLNITTNTCQAPVTCPTGQSRNPLTNVCETITICESPRAYDPASDSCKCPGLGDTYVPATNTCAPPSLQAAP